MPFILFLTYLIHSTLYFSLHTVCDSMLTDPILTLIPDHKDMIQTIETGPNVRDCKQMKLIPDTTPIPIDNIIYTKVIAGLFLTAFEQSRISQWLPFDRLLNDIRRYNAY